MNVDEIQYNAVIKDLTFDNWKLREQLRDYEVTINMIKSKLFCIGGFFNDYRAKIPKRIWKDLVDIRHIVGED